MAALPYMQLYIADYLADTMHLSTEEHGAYLLLMFNYWQTGKPIPKSRLAKIARVPNEKWSVVEKAVSEFFEDDGEHWVHLRIERDIENVNSSPRGKKLPNGDSLSGFKGYVYFISGPDIETVKIGYSRNPWARLNELRRSYGSNLSVVATIKTVERSEISIHALLANYRVEGEWFTKSECINSLISSVVAGEITTVEATNSYVSNYVVPATTTTNTDKDPDKDKELKDPPLPPKGKTLGNKFDPLSVELPEWLSPGLWAEWVAYRKQLGKPIKTQQGVSGSINKLAAYREQGHSPEYVVGLTMSNEWRGLLVPDGVAYKPRRDVNAISQPDKTVPDGFRG